MTEYENIELRSEKVRNIIGRVPPELVTGGTAYVIFLLVALFVATAAIPYPENIRAAVIVTHKDREGAHAEALIPYRYITRLKTHTEIQVEMEGYAAQKYGHKRGTIVAIEDSLISRNGNSYFRAYLTLKAPMKYDIKLNMQGVGTITVANRSILHYIIWK